MEKKRFSDQEKNFLLLMIDKYKNIIENKETDGATLHQKRKAWMEIEKRFNSESDHVERTVIQLQKCWDNIKTKRKRELAAAKRARLGTGGGPITVTKLDDSQVEVDAILLNSTNTELEDTLDSDTVMLLTCDSEPTPTYELVSDTFVPTSTTSTSTSTASAEESGTSMDNERPPIKLREHNTRKKKLLTARQAAVNIELEARLQKLSKLTDAEKELHEIRKKEAEVRQQLAIEELQQFHESRAMARKEEEIRVAIAQQNLDFQKRMYELQMQHAIEKHNIEMQLLMLQTKN